MDGHTIAILGGTGPHGRGLGGRFARAGHAVRLGSRDAERAAEVAAQVRGHLGLGDAALTGATNAEVVDGADLVVLATPYDAQAATLAGLASALRGKVVVSCVNPLAFDALGPYALEAPGGSAAQEAADALPDSRVVAAFHHLSARTLEEDGPLPDATVLVCGDDEEACALVVGLCDAVATRGGVMAGPLRHARHLEALTAVLLDVNRRAKAHASIALTGLSGH